MPAETIICVRVQDMTADPAAGSAQAPCSICGAPVWVAPSTQDMLASGRPFILLCMQCAKPASEATATNPEPARDRAEFERLKALAEKSYDQMYELHDDALIRLQFEVAYECLRDAARIARELGFNDEADAALARAEHIRKVYRHQFLQPPDLWA